MRTGAYRLFEIVAWPVAAWGGIELALRGASGSFDGAAESGLLWAMAASTVVCARWRRAVIATHAVASGPIQRRRR